MDTYYCRNSSNEWMTILLVALNVTLPHSHSGLYSPTLWPVTAPCTQRYTTCCDSYRKTLNKVQCAVTSKYLRVWYYVTYVGTQHKMYITRVMCF